MGNQKETAVRLLSENFTAVMEARSTWRAAVQQMFRDGEPVYLWGTGQMGQWAAHLVRDMGGQLAAFVDNNAARWGMEMEGVSCISPEQLREAADRLVVIGVGMSGAAVAAQLADMNIRRVLDMPDFYLNSLFDDLRSVNPADVAARVERCFDLLADERSRDVLLAKLEGFFKFEPGFGNQKYYEDVCQGDQYFQDDIIRFTEASVLVDCGAYTGDTMEDFLRRGYPFRKYIAYELTQQNYSVLQDNIKNVREGGQVSLLHITVAWAREMSRSTMTMLFRHRPSRRAVHAGRLSVWTIICRERMSALSRWTSRGRSGLRCAVQSS